MSMQAKERFASMAKTFGSNLSSSHDKPANQACKVVKGVTSRSPS